MPGVWQPGDQKVSVLDAKWRSGHERCKTCGHQDDWGAFCDPPLPKLVGPPPLVLDLLEEMRNVHRERKP